MRLTIVGCSGSMPGPDSAASSYLVQASGPDGDGGVRTWSLLLDLGSGAFGPLQRYVDPGEVDAVALSHLHPDHCSDVTALSVWLRYGPGAPGPRVPVLGPVGTPSRIAELALMATDEVAQTFAVETWSEGEPVVVGPFTITPHEVLHPVPAFGFRIAGPGEDGGTVVLGYTGDTDLCDGASLVAADVDLLLSEAAFVDGAESVRGIHLTGSRAGRLAADAGSRRLVLTHIQPWSDRDAIADAATIAYGRGVELAEPGKVFTL